MLKRPLGVMLAATLCLGVGGCTGPQAAETHRPSKEALPVQSEQTVPQIVIDVPDPRNLPAETVLSDEAVALYGEDACFTVDMIPDEVFARMEGKTFKANCTVPRDELRYIRVLHKNIDDETLVGEVVVHESVAQEICDIFHELYQAGYPIERMRLADDYDADDTASMEDDNTSGFNFRLIEGTDRISQHALGLAIDINPFYNPYYIPESDYVSPDASGPYADRSADYPYKIDEGDLCHKLFKEHGYTWGGDWTSPKDYQHFEK